MILIPSSIGISVKNICSFAEKSDVTKVDKVCRYIYRLQTDFLTVPFCFHYTFLCKKSVGIDTGSRVFDKNKLFERRHLAFRRKGIYKLLDSCIYAFKDRYLKNNKLKGLDNPSAKDVCRNNAYDKYKDYRRNESETGDMITEDVIVEEAQGSRQQI